MKNILPAIATVLAISISSWYFTTQTESHASSKQEEAISAVLVSVIKRLEVIEKKLNIKVPEQNVIEIRQAK